MNLHNSSLSQLLHTVYPEHEWLPWKFSKAPAKYWDDVKNQRKFIDWARKELKIKEINDWHSIKMQDIISLGGRILVNKYHWSMYQLLSSIYPEHDWLSWKYSNVNASNLKSNERKLFLDYVGKKLNVKKMEDWYKVKEEVKNIEACGLSVSIATH